MLSTISLTVTQSPIDFSEVGMEFSGETGKIIKEGFKSHVRDFLWDNVVSICQGKGPTVDLTEDVPKPKPRSFEISKLKIFPRITLIYETDIYKEIHRESARILKDFNAVPVKSVIKTWWPTLGDGVIEIMKGIPSNLSEAGWKILIENQFKVYGRVLTPQPVGKSVTIIFNEYAPPQLITPMGVASILVLGAVAYKVVDRIVG